MSTILAIARADFLERTRRYQYLLLIVATLVAGIYFVPARSAPYVTFSLDNYTGIYTSAWLGALFAAFVSIFVTLFGFYNVKSTIERDRQTHVGEIIASTPIGNFSYVFGKALSNLAVLASVMLILFVDAILMQFVRGESSSLNLVAIVLPMLLIALPATAMVAALAILFESLPILRGGIGNIVYFFLWIFGLAGSSKALASGHISPFDVFGVNFLAIKIYPLLPSSNHSPLDTLAMITEGGPRVHMFTLSGLAWSVGDVAERLVWFVVALAMVALAALVFDRFTSPARSRSVRVFTPFARFVSAFERISTPILNLVCNSDMGSLVLAEFRLMVNGLSGWWYVVAIGLWIGTLFATGTGQTITLALAWVWATLVWSQMGTREATNATEQLIFPSLHPLRRQFLAQWCAGVILAFLLGSGTLIHVLAVGNPHAVLGIVAGAFFLPTLALACGALSGTSRVFEIAYLVLWYVGPMNNSRSLDYTGSAAASAFAVATIALLALAFTSRRWRLQAA